MNEKNSFDASALVHGNVGLKKNKNKKSVAGVAGSVIEARHLTACSRMTPRAANA